MSIDCILELIELSVKQLLFKFDKIFLYTHRESVSICRTAYVEITARKNS